MEEVSVLKVRIRFSKKGPVKFVGHLDTMRYFQKAVRRAGLPAAFSGGYSPHMIMSFAAPLGVGVESEGEYFDLELSEDLPTEEIRQRLDSVMAEGVRVTGVRRVPDGKAGNAMSLVAAADYRVFFRPGKAPAEGWQERIQDFLAQKEILITKTTKTGEKQVDIRPFIYEMYPYIKEADRSEEEYGIFYRLASASANYTRPDTVTEAFLAYLEEELPPYSYQIQRLEVYADQGNEDQHRFVSLLDLGETVA